MRKCLLIKLLLAFFFKAYILLYALEKLMNGIYRPLISTRPIEEGTGMGLSLTHGIIAKHSEGKMKLVNEKWMNAELTIKLLKLK